MIIKKLMAFRSPDGVDHPAAVWRLAELHATFSEVRLTFYGYHDAAALAAGAHPIAAAVKEYKLPATTIGDHGDLESAIHSAAWSVAQASLEGDPPASFFQDAVLVE